MSWDDALKYAVVILSSFGGASGIIVLLIKFCAKTIAERLSKKYELRLNEDLEQYKNLINNKSYVSRTRFDTEFVIYEEISSKFLFIFDEIKKIAPSSDGIDGIEDVNGLYDELTEIKSILYRRMPILPQKIFDELSSVLSTLLDQVKYYDALIDYDQENDSDDSSVTLLKTKEDLDIIQENLINLIRMRVASLDVIN